MAILDAASLALKMNRPAIADPTKYEPVYVADVIADAQQAIATYLQYDPVLQAVVGEEGAVELDSSGYYRGLYRMRMAHAPFVPGAPSVVFSGLQLTFARSVLVTVTADLTYATVRHKDAQVFLSPGALSTLAGVELDLDGPYGSPIATGYVASYVAGYATGVGDPIPPGGGSYGAAPMPADITQAAVLLCRERIALDDASNLSTTNASAGSVTYIRTQTQEVKYQSFSQTSTASSGSALGSGSALAQAAARRLAPYRRTSLG